MSGRVATAEVNTITVLEFSFQTLQQQVVKVIAAELIVAVAGKHFGDVALNADDRNVKGAAAKPASIPASRVALRWASEKYAGTVMTAFSKGRFRSRRAHSTSSRRMSE